MATYLVVLLQFKLTLLRQTYKNNLLKAIKENVTLLMQQQQQQNASGRIEIG